MQTLASLRQVYDSMIALVVHHDFTDAVLRAPSTEQSAVQFVFV